MIERVHDHIREELRTNTRTDTIFVLTAILLNLITLGINSAVASSGDGTTTNIVMFMLSGLLIVYNLVAELGLIKGRQARGKLIGGLMKMYDDHEAGGYYDPSLLEGYKTRYTLFMIAVLSTGIVAITMPFAIR
jgi:hypothetical protein